MRYPLFSPKLMILYCRHSFKVNKDLLLDLYNHVFCLRIWEGKNKVSPRARFDQPKAFRLPASKKTSDSEDDVVGGRQINFPKVAHEQNRVRPNKSRVAEMQLSRANEISNLSLMTSPSPQKNSPITGTALCVVLCMYQHLTLYSIKSKKTQEDTKCF